MKPRSYGGHSDIEFSKIKMQNKQKKVYQCDQMAGFIILEHLSIYINQNLPKLIEKCQSRFKILHNTK